MPRHLQIVSTTPPDPADPVEPDEIVTWGDLFADLIYTAHTAGRGPLVLRMEALADEYAQVPLPDQS